MLFISYDKLNKNNNNGDENNNDVEIGEEYNDEELNESSFHPIKPSVNKELKIMAHDIMNTPGGTVMFKRKVENFTSRIKTTKNEIP